LHYNPAFERVPPPAVKPFPRLEAPPVLHTRGGTSPSAMSAGASFGARPGGSVSVGDFSSSGGALLRAARPHRSRRWSMPLSPALRWRQCGPGFGGCGRRSPGRPHRRCLGTFWVWGPPPGCRRIPTCTGYGCCFAWPCCMPSGCCGAPATVCARTGLSLGLPTLRRPPVSRSTRACVLTGRTWGWRAGGRTPRVLPWIPPSRQRSPRFGSAGVSAGCLPRCTRGLPGLLLPWHLPLRGMGPGRPRCRLGLPRMLPRPWCPPLDAAHCHHS